MCIMAFRSFEPRPWEPDLDICPECGAFAGEHVPGCPGDLLPVEPIEGEGL